MPNSIFPFSPHQFNFEENQKKFINYCKNNLKSLADNGEWEPVSWGIAELPRGCTKLNFNSGLLKNNKLHDSKQPFSQSFIDLAKAIVVYHKLVYGRSYAVTMQLFTPLRFLELLLIEEYGNAKLSNISNDFLHRLVNKVIEHYKGKNTAYYLSLGMKSIFSIFHKNALIPKSINWPSHLIKDVKNPIGTKGAKQNESKIADEEDIFNLAKIFTQMFEPNSPGLNGLSKEKYYADADDFVANVFVLLLAGPRRIGEVLSLPVDCLGSATTSEGKTCRTIKLFCEKGTGFIEQPIVSSLVPQVEEAVKRAKKASEQGRWLAKWLEEKPTLFPRHPECPKVTDDTPLTREQIGQALGGAPHIPNLEKWIQDEDEKKQILEISDKTGYDYKIVKYNLRLTHIYKLNLGGSSIEEIVNLARQHRIILDSQGIQRIAEKLSLPFSTILFILQRYYFEEDIQKEITSVAKKVYSTKLSPPYITLTILNREIHGRLPSYFPQILQNTPTKYQDGLFCRLMYQGSTKRKNKQLLHSPVASLGWDFYVNGKNSRGVSEEGTIWERFGVSRKDGVKPYMNTHSIRHYLDNLAANAGLSQLERAWWAGRNTPSHNDAYDHRTDKDFLKSAQKMEVVKANSYTMESDLVLDKVSRQLPITPDEVELAKASALSTPLGYCARSIQSLPCEIANDCINCTKNFCIKGDSEKKEQYLLELLRLTEMRLSKAYDAEDDGLSGASRYVIHQQKTLERLRQMAVLQKSPQLEAGTLLQIPQEESSPMALAINKLLKERAIERGEIEADEKPKLSLKRKRKK